MDTIVSFFDKFWSLEIMFQLALPIFVISYRMPKRKNFCMRFGAVVVGLFLLAFVPLATDIIRGLNELESLVTFSGLLALFVVAIMIVWDASIWQALFCATAGYTIQNLASGLVILSSQLVYHRAQVPLTGHWRMLFMLVITAAVYALGYIFFVMQIKKNSLVVVESNLMIFMYAEVVIAIIGLDIVIKGATYDGISFLHLIIFRLIHALICIFILFAEYELLYAKREREERDKAERLLAERERQYKMSRQNIDAINMKVHDMRHQIRALAQGHGIVDTHVLDDLDREISIYDSQVETGNKALDTILTEKSIAAQTRGITLSCIADGHALDMMSPVDIYSLFGNALDNAMEAVQYIKNAEKKTITLSVSRTHNMVAVNIENYFSGFLKLDKEGFPVTSKRNRTYHGFGVRSMKATVEKYEGSLHIGHDGTIFYVNMILPCTDTPAEGTD